MATSTLIQRLEDGVSAASGNRRQVETFLAAGTITAGDVVMWDTSQAGADAMLHVVKSALRALGQPLACGVALESAASGETIQVVVAGFAVANCAADTGTIVVGDPLVASVVTAGEVEVRVAADTARAFGVALEAADATTANFVNIFVYPQF
jgi:hypothetical protein